MSTEELLVSKIICYEESNTWKDNSQKIRILHFNDVYNIESRAIDPVGGCEH